MGAQAPCPFRGDHTIRKGFMHSPTQCPPPPGERGEHRKMKRMRAQKKAERAKGIIEQRGITVTGSGKPSASSDKRAGVKIKKP